MTNQRLHAQPGSVIVLEGLDKTGKSTQIDRMRYTLAPESVVFAHMPSGLTTFTGRVYRALESARHKPRSALATQLAHLSCHAENMPALIDAATRKALVLDRWWWSTLAYGWYGGGIPKAGLSETAFTELIHTIWAPITPSVIFVFLNPRESDENNAPGVAAGYRALINQYPEQAVVVPADDPERTQMFITDELTRRGLAYAGATA